MPIDSETNESSPPGANTIAIDLNCGMAVDRERSVSLEHDRQLLLFCSRGCRDEFLGIGPLREEARAEALVRRVLDGILVQGCAIGRPDRPWPSAVRLRPDGPGLGSSRTRGRWSPRAARA